MSRKIRSLLACIVLCCSASSLFSQVSHVPTTMQSPNAASLGLYGEIPVTPYAGLPNIEIPLYTLKEQDMVVPISLSYHASGVRPEAHPGWVGLGWNLTCGGSIRRKINDQPDEIFNVEPRGYYYKHDLLNNSNWNTSTFINQTIANGAKNLDDKEPDEFSFSYPGGSGVFYLDQTGNWKVRSDKPIKVTFNQKFIKQPFYNQPDQLIDQNIYGGSFAGFTITDEKGIQYVFGGSTNSIEFEINLLNQPASDWWKATAWYLTKIIDDNGYQITFNYEREGDLVAQLATSIYLDMGSKTSVNNGIWNASTCTTSSTYFANPDHYVTGQLIAPIYLASISGGFHEIKFERSTSSELTYSSGPYADQTPSAMQSLKWKQLNAIKITAPYSLSSSQPNYIAYNFAYNDKATERLMLQSLTRTNGYNTSDPPYVFSYDISQTLPPYLSNQTDHWGFYNGTSYNFNSYSGLTSAYYTSRQPNETYLRAGTLNKITYPTGGVTEFTYEPNYYGKRVQENRSLGVDPAFNTTTMAGGLRLRKTTSYDPNNAAIKQTKEYFYVTGYSNAAMAAGTLPSSGVLAGQPKYYYEDLQGYKLADPTIKYSESIFSSQGVLPASDNSLGTHVGYSEVTEKLSDGSYTKYYYTNFDNGHPDESGTTIQPSITTYLPVSSLETERGLLFKTEQYSDKDIPLQRSETQYLALNKNSEFVNSLSLNYKKTCASDYVAIGTAYKFYTYSMVPQTTISTTFDETGANALAVQRDYTYNNYHQVQTESSTNSKNEPTKTYYRYPYDVLGYTPSPTADFKEVSAFMVQHNVIGEPTEIINTRTINGSEYVTGASLSTYKPQTVVYQGAPVFERPAVDYAFESTEPVLKSSYLNYSVTGFNGTAETSTKDSRLQPQIQYLSYDDVGHLLTYAKRNDKITGLVWNYSKDNIIAAIDNVGTADFAYSSFEDYYSPGFSVTNYLSIYRGDAVTGSYAFSGNVTHSFSNPGTYIIRAFSKYAASPTLNGAVGTTISNGASGYIFQWRLVNPANITITGSAMDEMQLYQEGAQITTLNYDNLFGLRSKVSVDGKIENYDYDPMGRLLHIYQKGIASKKFIYSIRLPLPPPTVYYNKVARQSFTPKCAGIATPMEYVVPANKYTSTFSQADADAAATNDIARNGQIYVDTNGSTCDQSTINIMYGATMSGTAVFENTLSHKTLTYNFAANTGSQYLLMGALPKGHYNVTINVAGTHSVGVGLTITSMLQGSNVFTFSNVEAATDIQVIVN